MTAKRQEERIRRFRLSVGRWWLSSVLSFAEPESQKKPLWFFSLGCGHDIHL